MMNEWGIRKKIVRTILYGTVYSTSAHYMHTLLAVLTLTVGLGLLLGLIFVCFSVLISAMLFSYCFLLLF